LENFSKPFGAVVGFTLENPRGAQGGPTTQVSRGKNGPHPTKRGEKKFLKHAPPCHGWGKGTKVMLKGPSNPRVCCQKKFPYGTLGGGRGPPTGGFPGGGKKPTPRKCGNQNKKGGQKKTANSQPPKNRPLRGAQSPPPEGPKNCKKGLFSPRTCQGKKPLPLEGAYN